MRRKVEELAVRWKMKEPGRAVDTTDYSSVPLMSSTADDDDQVTSLFSLGQKRTGRNGGGGNIVLL